MLEGVKLARKIGGNPAFAQFELEGAAFLDAQPACLGWPSFPRGRPAQLGW